MKWNITNEYLSLFNKTKYNGINDV
jgi:hypothetical protein